VNGTVEARSISSLDGRDAVTLEVRKQCRLEHPSRSSRR
jgi:hypothetical protein